MKIETVAKYLDARAQELYPVYLFFWRIFAAAALRIFGDRYRFHLLNISAPYSADPFFPTIDDDESYSKAARYYSDACMLEAAAYVKSIDFDLGLYRKIMKWQGVDVGAVPF